ncbi:MAG TPA: DNA methyltransferase [Phycisphaerae bacterium]|nr:DNA methyltransferase [Phycisphaerae bacterium]
MPKLLRAEGNDQRLSGSIRDLAHQILIKWADLESSGKLYTKKETTLEGEFISDVFGRALGYTLFSENLPNWHLEQKLSLPAGIADAAIGMFAADGTRHLRAVIEFKGPKSNLDRDRSQGKTPVEQCWHYLNLAPDCPWGIVCNYVTLRLYHRNKTPSVYEVFNLQELREPEKFHQFYAVFSAGGILPDLLGQKARADALLENSEHRQLTVGKSLYKEYNEERIELIRLLKSARYGFTLDDAIRLAQKILDRVIFIAFCEDRDRLPDKALERTWRDVGLWTSAKNPRWQNFKNLFKSINEGNERAGITRYNGGLFDDSIDPEIDALDLDDERTEFFKDLGEYDFRDEVNEEVLGHIFEQSVTELEQIRTNPELLSSKAPKAPIGQRKREGIYYTPRHVTEYIVDHTVGAVIRDRFDALAKKFGIDPLEAPSPKKLATWIKFNEARLDALKKIRVCDPACGSGAFLIRAYKCFEDAYDEVVDALCLDQRNEKLYEEISRTILQENLFGVDLSPQAVEITQLALWLRTANRGQSLTDLSDRIKPGNTLVDDATVDDSALDWNKAFPAVMAAGGFDCIIGNPPYVKLQNFRKSSPRVAEFLVQRYRSAKTGNFDMYLPFIERGIELLKPDGRMGFIAPSVWVFNEYGRGLRELLAETGALSRFIDFKSHQVFEDATTYTALQFFSKKKSEAIEVADAGDGNLVDIDQRTFSVARKRLSGDAWALLGDADQRILNQMRKNSITLKEASEQIFQGLITSADAIYHVRRLRPGHYYSYALEREVELEDDIVRPLVSGEDAVPFATPPTEKYLIFPYRLADGGSHLLSEREMKKFRRTWAYLQKNEKALRAREAYRFDDDEWWRFGRPQNIDKQDKPKIGVPQTVNRLQAFIDPKGERFFNNVRVNGILERSDRSFSLWFLLALLNSTALDFFFKRIAKPKDREYFEANKQFIAPLPIPNVNTKDQKPLAKLAQQLADLHAKRLKASAAVHRRFQTDLPPKQLIEVTPLPPALTGRLTTFDETPRAEVLRDMERMAGRTFKPAESGKWDDYLTEQSDALARTKRGIADRLAELNDRVDALFNLSHDDIKTIREKLA